MSEKTDLAPESPPQRLGRQLPSSAARGSPDHCVLPSQGSRAFIGATSAAATVAAPWFPTPRSWSLPHPGALLAEDAGGSTRQRRMELLLPCVIFVRTPDSPAGSISITTDPAPWRQRRRVAIRIRPRPGRGSFEVVVDSSGCRWLDPSPAQLASRWLPTEGWWYWLALGRSWAKALLDPVSSNSGGGGGASLLS